MEHEITDLRGQTRTVDCLACSIQKNEVENPGRVAESEHFVAEQDYEYPIPGFVIVVSKRHLMSVDEFTEAEQQDFIKFLCRVRSGMRQTLGIEHVYLIQEEDTSTSHFHVWLFPRYAWMKEKFNRKVESVRPIMEYAKEHLKTEEGLQEVDAVVGKLKNFFDQN